jgi:hypothetical protein
LGHSRSSGSSNSDTDSGRLVLISHTAPLQLISSSIAALARAFNLRCDKTVWPAASRSWGEAIDYLLLVNAELTRQQQQMEARTGRPGGQGPELALSNTSRQYVQLMVSAMQQVQEFLTRVLGQDAAQGVLVALSPSAVMTVVVEHFAAITRKVNPTPSALQHALLVPKVVREQQKRSTAGFSYYTGSKQHYDFGSAAALPKQQQQQQQQSCKTYANVYTLALRAVLYRLLPFCLTGLQ